MLTVRSIVPTFDRVLSFNRELDRALGEVWTNGTAWLPATDVVEKADRYLITIDLPGVKPESVEIGFEKNTLTIKGTRTGLQGAEDEELQVYVAERRSGAFERSFQLPEHVDAEGIEAHFEHGVLSVSVPKKAAAQPRKITIKAA